MIYFIAGLAIGIVLACMFSGDSLGGINMIRQRTTSDHRSHQTSCYGT